MHTKIIDLTINLFKHRSHINHSDLDSSCLTVRIKAFCFCLLLTTQIIGVVMVNDISGPVTLSPYSFPRRNVKATVAVYGTKGPIILIANHQYTKENTMVDHSREDWLSLHLKFQYH